jgi:hypothetical protein
MKFQSPQNHLEPILVKLETFIVILVNPVC